MIDLLPGVALPRPAPAADAGPLDERLYDLVEARVRRLFTHNPALATMRGIHTEDHHLGDGSRDRHRKHQGKTTSSNDGDEGSSVHVRFPRTGRG